MKDRPGHRPPMEPSPALTASLVEYADRLLLGTGLQAADALSIASGRLDPPVSVARLAHALRSGWELTEDCP